MNASKNMGGNDQGHGCLFSSSKRSTQPMPPIANPLPTQQAHLEPLVRCLQPLCDCAGHKMLMRPEPVTRRPGAWVVLRGLKHGALCTLFLSIVSDIYHTSAAACPERPTGPCVLCSCGCGERRTDINVHTELLAGFTLNGTMQKFLVFLRVARALLVGARLSKKIKSFLFPWRSGLERGKRCRLCAFLSDFLNPWVCTRRSTINGKSLGAEGAFQSATPTSTF